MALREYRCLDCQAVFDRLDFDKSKLTCPYCGSENLEEKFSTFTWVFRGAFEWFEEEENANAS